VGHERPGVRSLAAQRSSRPGCRHPPSAGRRSATRIADAARLRPRAASGLVGRRSRRSRSVARRRHRTALYLKKGVDEPRA
jgi:hypothetical protein